MAKAPKVKAITRKNSKFTFAWDQQESNIIDQEANYTIDYSTVKGQNINAYINSKKTDLSVGKSTKQKTVTIDLSAYNGDTKILQAINFNVRGKYQVKNKKGKVTGTHWTDWAGTRFLLKPPSVTLTSEHTATNATKFTWNCAADSTGHTPAKDVIYQSILVKDCPVSKAADFRYLDQWKNASKVTKSLSGNKTETEVGLGSDSYTRIVRVRARGAGGTSAGIDGSTWKYASYCYGTPYAAENMTVSARQSSEGINVDMWFTAPNDAAHRISQVDIEYNIAEPLSGMEPPATGWESGWTLKDKTTTKPEHIVFDIPNKSVGADQLLFIRVKTNYGDRFETNDPVIALWTYLSDPTIDSVTPNASTHSVQITATNTSAVSGSDLIVSWLDTDGNGHAIGTLSGTGQHTGTFTYPEDVTPESFTVQAQYLGINYGGGEQTFNWYSHIVYQSGTIPKAPTSVTVEPADRVGVMKVSWDWNWDDADQAEVSWSDYENAWESTDQPDTYLVSKVHSNYLFVTGIETGVPIYVRVRFTRGYDDDAVYGPYSETETITLESAPDIPVLELTKGVISAAGETKATWVYVSKDGSEQAKAQICEWDPDEEEYSEPIVEVEGEQFCNISGDTWSTGTTHLLCVRVWSTKGQPSEWSEPVPLSIAEPITCTISSTSLVTEQIDIGDSDTRACLSLKALPLTVTVTGVGESGIYRLLIKRAAPYHVPRPDDNVFDGYEGETIGIFEQTGNGSFSIGADDRLMFDDDGTYTLEATVSDSYGQSDTKELEFEVHWTVQALMPTMTVTTGNKVARITPRAETQTGATCDIYRLSADKPQLILQDGTFGKVYVDPYPAIGEHGGYRVVFKTANGDYTTAQGRPAWYDVATNMQNDKTIINFNGETVELAYNIDESNSWSKDFKKTHYLGGAVQGYWNAGVERSGSLKTVAVSTEDGDMIDAMRRLAAYSGVCHVRTIAGASYDADIQVSEDIPQDTAHKVLTFNLSVNKVDSSGTDAMELSQWEANQ